MAKSPSRSESAKKKINSSLNDRKLIEEQTAVFLKSGGKITQIPTGTSGASQAPAAKKPATT